MSDKDSKDAEDRFALARKALAGVPSKAKTDSDPKTDQGKSAAGAPSGDAGAGMLSQLVSAMKGAPGAISAVEPEGYILLDPARSGSAIGPDAKLETVDALQRALRRLGHDCPETGRYDDKTIAAVKRLQQKSGLPADGVFEANTIAALDKALGLSPRNATADEPIVPRSGAQKNLFPETGNAFLDSLVPGAVKGMHASGFPASVVLAMAAYETGWGESALVRDARNVFGLKGKGPEGSLFLREDGTPGEGAEFRKYAKAADSVADFMKLFATSDAYRAPMSHKERPESFALALVGSYSPDPKYGTTLLRLMKQFDLFRFDRIRAI